MAINFEVIKENFGSIPVTDAYAQQFVEIHVNKNLIPRLQAECVLHEVIEAYLPTIPHESIDAMTNSLMDALDDVVRWDNEQEADV